MNTVTKTEKPQSVEKTVNAAIKLNEVGATHSSINAGLDKKIEMVQGTTQFRKNANANAETEAENGRRHVNTTTKAEMLQAVTQRRKTATRAKTIKV